MVIQITPRNLVFILFKRKNAILGFLLATVVFTALYFALFGWRFQSQAQFSVNLAKTIIGSMAITAASYDIEKKTVEKVGAKTLYPSVPKPFAFGNAQEQAIDKLDGDYDQKV